MDEKNRVDSVKVHRSHKSVEQSEYAEHRIDNSKSAAPRIEIRSVNDSNADHDSTELHSTGEKDGVIHHPVISRKSELVKEETCNSENRHEEKREIPKRDDDEIYIANLRDSGGLTFIRTSPRPRVKRTKSERKCIRNRSDHLSLGVGAEETKLDSTIEPEEVRVIVTKGPRGVTGRSETFSRRLKKPSNKRNCHPTHCEYCYGNRSAASVPPTAKNRVVREIETTFTAAERKGSIEIVREVSDGLQGEVKGSAPVKVARGGGACKDNRRKRIVVEDQQDQSDSPRRNHQTTHHNMTYHSDLRARSESSSSRRSTPRSELFTQMEPLFPQYASLHAPVAKHYCSTEEIVRAEKSTTQYSAAPPVDLITQENIEKPAPEVRFAHTNGERPSANDVNVALKSVDLKFEPNVANGRSNSPGVENVQLMRASERPVTSITYLPQGESRSPYSTDRPPLTARPRSASRMSNESELIYKRVASVSNPPGKAGYSAHRERLKQERERELLLRHQRQLAASSTGLNDQRLTQQSMQQHQYRSLSAVNTAGDAVEEIETIILQPIGRGVQDIDSRTGSMTTLARTGGSLIDGRSRLAYSARAVSPRFDTPLLSRRAHSGLPPVHHHPRARSVSPFGHPVPLVTHHYAPRTAQGPYTSVSREQHYKPNYRTPSLTRHTPPISSEPLQVQIPHTAARPPYPSILEASHWPTVTAHTPMPIPSSRGNDVEFTISGREEIRGMTPPPPRIQALPYGTVQQEAPVDVIRRSSVDFPKIEDELDHPEDCSLNRMETPAQRAGIAGRGYSSTQFLNRGTTPTSELARPIPIHQTQAVITPSVSSQPLQTPRYGTPTTTMMSNGKMNQLNGSRSHLSSASSTLVAQPPAMVQTNGWNQETQNKSYMDNVATTSLSIVQDTAPAWYRPNLSREAAIRILRTQAPGNFLIRDSTTFKGAYGLAVKVATLPPKVTPKSDDLQSELVRHYLIEVVNTPSVGVRLKGFASEPVFPSLAALIHHHTYDPLALPCLLTLPPVPTHLPSSGSATLPQLVIGTVGSGISQNQPPIIPTGNGMDTVASSASLLGRTVASSDLESTNQVDGSIKGNHRPNDHTMLPMNVQVDENVVSSQNVPFVCVLRESPTNLRSMTTKDNGLGQGYTFRCLMLGSVDTPQWDGEVCFSRAVDQLIPLSVLTAAECDNGISRVRYTEAQLHVSAHDGITIIDLQRRLLLRRHLPNHILVYCGLEHRKKEFQHPEHQLHGITHPQIFGIVVRKGISECTTHVFSECEPTHTASAIVQHIRATYPHLNVR